MIIVSSIYVLKAGACSETVGLSKGDQKEDEHDHLEESVASVSLEMGCCGCADEPSSKVEPSPKVEPSSEMEPTDSTVNVFPIC